MKAKSFFLLMLSLAGFTPLWAQETVVWELVTDYSNLSTSDTYVIAGSGISGGKTTWYSLKNNEVKNASTLPIGSTLTIAGGIITSRISDDETWVLESVTGADDVFYIKSTKGENLYLEATSNTSSYIRGKQDNNNNKWKIHYTDSYTNNNNTRTVTGLYLPYVNNGREMAVFDNGSDHEWRSYGPSNYNNVDKEEVVLYRKKVSVTVSTALYATFCSENAVNFTGTGITAYKAKSDGSKVVLTAITDGIVPARTGVVLYSPEAVTYNVPVTVASGSTGWADNELVGITERTSVREESEDGKTNYIFAKESSGIGFYLAAADGAYLRANRAYLSTKITTAAPYLGFDDEGTTGIGSLTPALSRGEGVYYDLSGRRVALPTKGLYIVNGKKVVMK